LICPYNICYIEQVTQCNRDFIEDTALENFTQQKLIESRVFMECGKKDCAVFYKAGSDEKARCHYNG